MSLLHFINVITYIKKLLMCSIDDNVILYLLNCKIINSYTLLVFDHH